VSNGFHVGTAASGQLACAAPVRNRPSRQARLGKMLRQHFRLSLTDVREFLFQRLGDAGVQLLAPALEHRLVGSVLNQRMLEGVGRLGRRATAENQLRADQLLKGITQLVRGHRRHRRKQLVGELPADHGTGLDDLLDRSEAVEAGHQRIV
jgi:hypothetical protein